MSDTRTLPPRVPNGARPSGQPPTLASTDPAPESPLEQQRFEARVRELGELLRSGEAESLQLKYRSWPARLEALEALVAPRLAQRAAQTARPSAPTPDSRAGDSGGQHLQPLPPSAPASAPRPWFQDVTLYVDPDGFEHALTVYAPTGQEALAAGLAAAKGLKGRNCKPVIRAAPVAASGGPPAPDSGARPSEPPICKYHGRMKESSKAPGTFFCSRKMGDGSYCQERWPEK